ncbi:MAG: hypothetical protein OXC69_01675 [Candidatus Tectomicrobia bacterium]|nr:hypothetical protein [Candidatus Tectomicrobia bacterium]
MKGRLSMRNKGSMRLFLFLFLTVAVIVAGCGSGGENGENGTESGGEHGPGGEGAGEGSGEGGEESGASLALDEMYDVVRKGARLTLVLGFDGVVENTTDATLQNVRVEVHLSNGVELGPVFLGDLAPREMVDVFVPVETPDAFDGWTPHAEVGPGSGEAGGEHGAGGEGAGGEGGGEHGSSGETGNEGSGEGGEESGASLALDEMYDALRKGARLTLELGFDGVVENTTNATLQNVRVEVHLSNGVELGPEVVGDLAAWEMADVFVPVETPDAFDGWTPHAEVGPGSGEAGGEHGPGGEGGSG